MSTPTATYEPLLDQVTVLGRRPALTRDAYAWYARKLDSLAGRAPITPQRVMRRAYDQRYVVPHDAIKRGSFYFYSYNPIHRVTLPYYDKFPLVLILDKDMDGVLGLNLHYLPYLWRAKLFDGLMTFANDPKLTMQARIRVTYRILDSLKRMRMFRPCLKRYRFDAFMTPAFYVHPREWSIAMFLPVHRFEKAYATEVWKDSRESF